MTNDLKDQLGIYELVDIFLVRTTIQICDRRINSLFHVSLTIRNVVVLYISKTSDDSVIHGC